MISVLETTIFILLFLIVYLIFLKPFVPLLILKLKLGDKAILMFSPILGFNAFADDSTKRKQDFMFAFNHELKKNPKAVVILTNVLHKPFLVITGPEHIKDMYTDHHSYVKLDPFKIQNFMEKGLIMSEGVGWKRQRRFLGTAFTFEKLKARIPMINEVVNKISDTDPKNNLNYFTSKITGEVVIQSFFGKLAQGLQFNGQDAQVALVELLNEIYVLPMKNPYVLFKHLVFEKKAEMIAKVETFKKIVKELIIKRIEELKLNPILDQENMVFLDIYVTEYLKEQNSQNKTIDIEEIIHQFITLFFAGTDTTATLSSLCLYYLARFPEIQNEILQEVQQVVGNGDITEQHLNRFEKINAFIQEVLRLRNPALMILTRYVRNDKQLLDIKLSKGWLISAYHNAGNQLDKHFDNPEEFDYRRWLTNKSIIKEDNGYIYIPFAAGQRNCIGQHMAILEAKMILAILVRKYQIQLNPAVKQIRFGLRFLYCVEPDNCLIFEPRK